MSRSTGTTAWVLAGVLGAAALAQAQQVQQVAPGVYAFRGSAPDATNSGFLVTSEGVVVIDTQLSIDDTQALADAIRQVTDQPVRYLINTNPRFDRTFGNSVFRGAEIIGHQATKDFILANRDAFLAQLRLFLPPGALADFQILPPTRTIAASTTFHLGGRRIDLLYFGAASTPGDLVVYLPDVDVAFTGDLYTPGVWPPFSEADVDGWFLALDELRRLAPGLVVPGRGRLLADASGITAQRLLLTTLTVLVSHLLLEGADAAGVLAAVRESPLLAPYESWQDRRTNLPGAVRRIVAELGR